MTTHLKLAAWRVRRIVRDQRGVSAIEFAMVVPALIFLYVGAVELNNALTIYRRSSEVAATAADLTAQVKQITKDDIQDIQAAASSILTPFPDAPLTIVLTSVVADENNETKVDWSCSNKGGAHAKGAAFALPAGLTEADSSVVVAETIYNFTPLLNLTEIFSPGSFEMKRTFYSRPRRSLKVDKIDTGC